jgi:hypothetical protein
MPAVTCPRNGLNHPEHPLQHTHHLHHSRNTPALPNHQHPRTIPSPNTYPPRSHANATRPSSQARTRPQKTAPFTPNTDTNTDALGSDTPPQTSSNTPPAAAFIARHAPNHLTASPHHGTTTLQPPRLTTSKHHCNTATQHHQLASCSDAPNTSRPRYDASCTFLLLAACCLLLARSIGWWMECV